jgi:carboxypeptidase C (cathepsin A)
MRSFIFLAWIALAVAPVVGHAQVPEQRAPDPRAAELRSGAARPGPTADPARLPADAVTHQSLDLPGRTLRFTATAGAIRLTDDHGAPNPAPLADVAFIAYQLENTAPNTRPVTFVFNGGPGMASGWLNVGAVGPWRVPLRPEPSASGDPLPNAETWLDFTDLVFIDPPGTGYSRVLASGEDATRRIWSVDGDVAILAETVRRWLEHSNRSLSPKYILGESYGAFRGPRLVRRLESEEGIGVSGLVLLSPLLDVHEESGFTDPLGWATRLPSVVASIRAEHGPVTRGNMADVEQYAQTDYVTDFLRGVRDRAAVDRMSTKLAALTGLDPALVRRFDGRLDADVVLHERSRAERRVGSIYDATITSADPFPHRPMSDYPDPVIAGFKPAVTTAMVALYRRFGWQTDALYRLENDAVFGHWDWGRGMGRPQSVAALQTALALDPKLKVLIAHGLFDLRTPYFTTALMLAQVPDLGGSDRLRLAVYPGGHMFYSVDASRTAFRDDARGVFGE